VVVSSLSYNRKRQPGSGSITNLASDLILLMMYQSQPLKMHMSNENIQLWLEFN
jgi:hypothetical protein